MTYRTGDSPDIDDDTRTATMVHDRFQITRHGSGYLCSFMRLADAVRFCQDHKYRTELTIFDAMAHHGKPERWDWNGIVQSLRLS